MFPSIKGNISVYAIKLKSDITDQGIGERQEKKYSVA